MGELDKLFFHEDDFCQTELLPKENFFKVQKDLIESLNVAQSNFTELGFGRLYTREQAVHTLGSKNIAIEDFRSVLKVDSLFFFDKIYTGYSSYEERVLNSEGFGYENYVILYKYENDIITSVWIIYKLLSKSLDTFPERLKKTLWEIGKTWDIILVDWNEYTLCNIGSLNSIDEYLHFRRT